jgi:NADPH:quinone reductase-like Zn-dependent oxidoreductase
MTLLTGTAPDANSREMAKAAFGASILLTAVLALAQRPDEVPLADLLEVLVLDRQLVAIDARGGGQKATPLRFDERVSWTGARGKVGVALTDQRILAVAVGSATWQEADRRLAETLPSEALLGDRVHPMVANHIADLAKGALRVVIDSRFPLAEAAEAHRRIESRLAFGRALLIP